MTRINTNVASTRGLRYLNQTSKSLDTTLERLSTGSKINRGQDAPAGIIASEGLRLQITSIEQSIKNSNRASNILATADGALGEINGLLNQIRGLVQEGLNSGALSDAELEANQLQIDAALSAINRVSQNTSFNGNNLLDGSKSYTTSLSTADAAKLSDYQINEAFLGTNSSLEVAAVVQTAAEQGELTRVGALERDLSIEVSGKDGTQVLFFNSGASAANIAEAVNAVTEATGVTAELSNDVATAGTLDIAGTADTITLTEKAAFGDTIAVSINNAASATDPSSISVTFNDDGTIDIDILVANDGTDPTATFQDITDLINNDAVASTLVTAEISAGDGTELFAAGDLGDQGTVDTGKITQSITFTSLEFGSDAFVEFKALSGAFTTTNADDETTTRDVGTDIVATINGTRALGKGLRASVKTATLDASVTFTSDANTAANTATITVSGGGSTFQISDQVSSSGQINVGIESVNTARLGGVTGKLYELGTGGGKSLLDVGPEVAGNDLVKIIDEALERVAKLRGRLGAVQKNVIETNVSALGVALENLSAARSEIADTDFAAETAALTRAQILSQANISVLAIANQQPQQVLSLLR